jgi:hypothetical protein
MAKFEVPPCLGVSVPVGSARPKDKAAVKLNLAIALIEIAS